ncbi:MAG: hypothetical protein RIQ33_1845 [Bacteroidota bacterium]
MPFIEIKRVSENINLFRDYKLYLDDKEIGRIAIGETMQFEIQVVNIN